MTLEQNLPPGLTLSKAEKTQLAMIERAAAQTTTGRVAEVLSVAAIPAALMVVYGYLLHRAPEAGLALCKLHGTLYIPQDPALDKLLRLPMAFLFMTAILWVTAIYNLQEQRRLLHKIFTHIAQQPNDA